MAKSAHLHPHLGPETRQQLGLALHAKIVDFQIIVEIYKHQGTPPSQDEYVYKAYSYFRIARVL